MPLARSEITFRLADSTPKDYTTNTIYHTIDDGTFDPSVDWGNHAQQVLDCFTGNAANHSGAIAVYSGGTVDVTVYDMADPKPRPEKAHVTYTNSGGAATESTRGPGQVALCMSYYGSRNLPSHRGRIYLGPWTPGDLTHRPTDALLDGTNELGHALFDVGGENVAWVVHSEKLGTVEPITTIWCDDSWDTQRRRTRKATKRHTVAP